MIVKRVLLITGLGRSFRLYTESARSFAGDICVITTSLYPQFSGNVERLYRLMCDHLFIRCYQCMPIGLEHNSNDVNVVGDAKTILESDGKTDGWWPKSV